MNKSATPSTNSPASFLPRPHRFVRRLALMYAVLALSVGLFLSIRLLPPTTVPQIRSLADEAVTGGMGGIVLTALLLTCTGLAATLAMTFARFNASASRGTPPPGLSLQARIRSRFEPGFAARVGQALIVTVGTALICTGAWLLWPAVAVSQVPANSNVAAALVFALAFVSLVAERSMHAFPEPQLPEAPALHRLLLLTTLLLAAAACVELGRSAQLAWIRWPALLLILLPCAVALELMTRAAARLFLPPPTAERARAVVQSIVATLLTAGPRGPGGLLRTHLGLDFARSWALSYLSAALLPAIGVTALFCWGLSGLKLIDLGQRGIYERFGAPVAVLGPGMHLLMPWPLGRLRPVEFGAIHSVAVGADPSGVEMETDSVAAEALPPASLNRLWESTHPGQAEYLVASQSTGLQGFQTVSTEISVLYRVGLSDGDALQSVYSVAEPETLVKEAASRLVLRYFNSRTLDAVLGAKRENIADALRAALVADLNARHAGIDVVSVLIEEIHPPAGAAAAYHAVQAAQINASASISNETGRAKRTEGIARQEAHQLTAAAAAKAEEISRTADADAYQFGADRRAYTEAGRAFLLERSNRNIVAALTPIPLTIVDHRLTAAQAPLMDMRNVTSRDTAPTAVPNASKPPSNPGGTSDDTAIASAIESRN